MSRLFISREKRDEAYRVARGNTRGKLVRGTVKGQQLHPMYIEDWEGPEKDQTGLGNTVYKMYHAKLYSLDVM